MYTPQAVSSTVLGGYGFVDGAGTSTQCRALLLIHACQRRKGMVVFDGGYVRY